MSKGKLHAWERRSRQYCCCTTNGQDAVCLQNNPRVPSLREKTQSLMKQPARQPRENIKAIVFVTGSDQLVFWPSSGQGLGVPSPLPFLGRPNGLGETIRAVSNAKQFMAQKRKWSTNLWATSPRARSFRPARHEHRSKDIHHSRVNFMRRVLRRTCIPTIHGRTEHDLSVTKRRHGRPPRQQ